MESKNTEIAVFSAILSKTEIAKMAAAIAEKYKTEGDAPRAIALAKVLEEAAKVIRAELVDTALAELQREGVKGTLTIEGCTIATKAGASTYDYTQCNDATYNALCEQLEELKEAAKAREKMLQTLPHPIEIGGIMVSPAVKIHGKETIVITLKK